MARAQWILIKSAYFNLWQLKLWSFLGLCFNFCCFSFPHPHAQIFQGLSLWILNYLTAKNEWGLGKASTVKWYLLLNFTIWSPLDFSPKGNSNIHEQLYIDPIFFIFLNPFILPRCIFDRKVHCTDSRNLLILQCSAGDVSIRYRYDTHLWYGISKW